MAGSITLSPVGPYTVQVDGTFVLPTAVGLADDGLTDVSSDITISEDPVVTDTAETQAIVYTIPDTVDGVAADITVSIDVVIAANPVIKVRALTDGGLSVDRVVINRLGNNFSFNVSPKGTDSAAVETTSIGGLDAAYLVSQIRAKVGMTIDQNPVHSDVYTDDGANGDDTADDGVNDGTRYNWLNNGLLYEVIA